MKNKVLFILFAIVCSGCIKTPRTNAKNSSNKSEAVPASPTITPSLAPTATPTPIQIDPLVSQAWHLLNTGQNTYSLAGGTPGEDINMGSVTARGAGILIAVSDNGVEKEHEDLAANFSLAFSKNYSLSGPNWSGDPAPDDSAHGTAVSGIIAAAANNNLGSRGVASMATIAGLKYIGAPSSLSKQVDQANGAYDIFNYSYGRYSCYFANVSSVYLSQLEYGVENLRGGKGAIYVKAAGNEYAGWNSDCDGSILEEDDTYYLGNANLEQVHSYPWMIVTGAINADGYSASYSTPGSSLWISAPGGEYGVSKPAILTTDLSGCDRGYSKSDSTANDFEAGSASNLYCNYTSTMNGTSSATPIISGVVALLLEINPSLSWRDVKHIFATTAEKVHASSLNINHPGGRNLVGHIYERGWVTNQAGYSFHNWFGFGAVDVSSAVAMATGYSSSLGALVNVNAASGLNLDQNIPDNSSTGVQSILTIASDYKIEAVQISLNLSHTLVGDLGVELTSPSGTTSTLMNINSGILISDIVDDVLLSNAFYGETSAGSWSLKIIDGKTNDTGTLNNWSIKVYGH